MALTLEIALKLVQACAAAAAKMSLPVAAAVVDRGGHVIASGRTDSTGFISLDVAQRKAVTSANFGAPTQALMEMLQADAFQMNSVMSIPGLSLLPGGMPIVMDGQVVGALGVAGAHYSQDHSIAEEAMKAIA